MRYASLFTIVLLLAGCAAQTTPLPTLAGLNSSLPFPVDHAASVLTGNVLPGKNAQSHSGAAQVQGNALSLPASSTTQFAVYRFSGVASATDDVVVTLDEGQPETAWMGVANFTTQRWELSGPFSTTPTVPLTTADDVSPLGNVYIAVIALPHESALIDQLQLFTVNLAPTAAATALPASGPTPLLVSFDGTFSSDQDGTITDYEWDFDGNGTYNEPGAEATAHGNPTPAAYLYAVPGSFIAQLKVTDNVGATDVINIPVNASPPANQPPSASFTATPASGNPGDPVALDASASSDPNGSIAHYEWDLDGNGSFETDGGLTPTQGTSLPTPAGTVAVGLRVTDDHGLQATTTRSITSWAPGWLTLTIDSAGSVGTYTSLAEVNGYPAITYSDLAHQRVKYAYSTSPDGSAGWSSLTVDNVTADARDTSLAVVDGKPAVSYYAELQGFLKFARSSQSDGSSGWTALTVDNTGDTGYNGTSLTVVNGHPAISYYERGARDLRYAYSSQADGGSGWSHVTVDATGQVGEYSSLEVVDGHPAISYTDQTASCTKYAWSTTADGSGGWSSVAVNTPGNVGYFSSLAVVNGYPSISYIDSSSLKLQFARSSALDGSTGWSAVQVYSGSQMGNSTALAEVNGLPVIAYFLAVPGQLRYATTNLADGSGGWSTINVDTSGHSVGSFTSLALINGFPAVSYWDQSTDDLKYAVLH